MFCCFKMFVTKCTVSNLESKTPWDKIRRWINFIDQFKMFNKMYPFGQNKIIFDFWVFCLNIDYRSEAEPTSCGSFPAGPMLVSDRRWHCRRAAVCGQALPNAPESQRGAAVAWPPAPPRPQLRDCLETCTGGHCRLPSGTSFTRQPAGQRADR